MRRTLCHSILFDDVTTLVWSHNTKVYMDNVSLKYFGTQAQVNAKPLRWQDTLALINVDLAHKPQRDNVVFDVLCKRDESQTMSTT